MVKYCEGRVVQQWIFDGRSGVWKQVLNDCDITGFVADDWQSDYWKYSVNIRLRACSTQEGVFSEVINHQYNLYL